MRFHLFFLELACTTCCTAVDNPETSYWYYMFFKWTLVEEERKKKQLKVIYIFIFFQKRNQKREKNPFKEFLSVLSVLSHLFHFILLVSFHFPKTFIYLKTKVFYTFLKAGSGRKAASSTQALNLRLNLSYLNICSFPLTPLLQMEHRNISCRLHL